MKDAEAKRRSKARLADEIVQLGEFVKRSVRLASTKEVRARLRRRLEDLASERALIQKAVPSPSLHPPTSPPAAAPSPVLPQTTAQATEATAAAAV